MRSFPHTLTCFAFTLTCFAGTVTGQDVLPRDIRMFLADHCLDCHSSDVAEGDVVLDGTTIQWRDKQTAETWANVHQVLRSGEMPPPDAEQPTEEERQQVVELLDQTLTKHIAPGGTIFRRLNREEYEHTVRSVLGIPFTVPQSFPADTVSHGFDNIGEGLVLSPPLMAQYVEMATAAADQIFPPTRRQAEVVAESFKVTPSDFSLNFTTGHEIDGILRMASSCDPLSRGSVWPNRFEARVGGVYEVEIDLSSFKPTKGHSPEVHLIAKPNSGSNFAKASTLRKLAEFHVEAGNPQTYHATVELKRGENIVVHYENAPLSSDKTERQAFLDRISGQLLDAFRDDPELGAAWMKAGHQRSDRGWSWWKRIQETRLDPSLDVASFDVNSPIVKDFTLQMARQSVNTVETMACMTFFKGPCLDIHRMSIAGPSRVIDDEEVIEQRKRTARFMGERADRDDASYATAILKPFLDKAFRRPVTDHQLAEYVTVAMDHQADGHRFEDGLHLAVRAALCSTHFLFREFRPGPLDEHDLAARLSYFLASSPPDYQLREVALSGAILDPEILERQARRLMGNSSVKKFLESFTGQWLGLRTLPQIMPDPRLLKWTSKDLAAITSETELFVAEILHRNLPLETFIDPDFTYLNKRNAKLYDIKFPNSDTIKRVSLPRGGRRGGILTQASVLMATANGVDTQPVLRGAWILENIFGTPTPPPPSDVPAVEPDTSGAKTIRELLDRHQADMSCARCHRKIDPPGFVLENFDPVGRWRDHYPLHEKIADQIITRNGQPVDSTSEMPDGTEMKDITDLKRYLVLHIEMFSKCLTGKLLTYATGRPMNYGDRKVIDQIVRDVAESGNGFADLIVAVVQSESFRTK